LIKKGLSLGLNESIALSKYGLFIVSDFDLYHNMNTPKAYDSFLESLKFNKNRPEYIKLRQNRLNLDQFITRIKNMTVTNFGLIGTPSQEKPIKPMKTRADVASNIASDVKKLQLRDKKKARIDSEHTKTTTEKEQPEEVLEGEKDEGEDGLESDSEYEQSEEVKYVGSKRQSNRNVKGNGLPVSSEMSVVLEETTAPPPPLQGESCAVRIDKEYFSKLHSVKTQLSELFGDFKEGTTLMLKYDFLSEKLFVHGTESDDFIDWDNTLQFELRKNKVTYNVSYSCIYLFHLMIIIYSKLMKRRIWKACSD